MPIDRTVPAVSHRDFLENLNATRLRLNQEARAVSSGRRLHDPSDDPANIARLLQLKDSLAGVEQYGRNVASGRALLSFTDSVLDSVVNQMNVVIQRGTQAATGTTTAQARAVIGDEITAIRDQLLGLANSTFQGNYIFSGTRTDPRPFTLSGGGVTYQGNLGVTLIDVGPGVTGPTNLPGSQVFTANGASLFGSLQGLITALRTPSAPPPDQGTQISTAMTQVAQAFDQVRNSRSTIGGYLGSFERAKTVLDGQRFQLISSASAIEDADLAESIANMIKE